MNKFWNWIKNETDENILFLNGTIAEESWFDDDITPRLFKSELGNKGDITVWINSPGGDCIAAAQIYNMLISHSGKVTVKIDGICASAASVIAMAGDRVIISPVSMVMIHNPMTMAFGDKTDMSKAIAMLDEVKESIINAYKSKTNLSRAKLSTLMDNETWMNANKAIELGFADEILSREKAEDMVVETSNLYSRKVAVNTLRDKIAKKCEVVESFDNGITSKDKLSEHKNEHAHNKASNYINRLNLIKSWR